jgi:hypothetical protein
MMFGRTIKGAGLTAVLALAVLTPSAAQADPVRNGDALVLTCDGQSYDVVIAGRGAWLPAHDLDSNRIFVPTSFGEANGTVTIVATGEVIDEFTDPALWKGRATRERSTSVDCTYSSSFEFYDQELEQALHIDVIGSVEGFYTPAR